MDKFYHDLYTVNKENKNQKVLIPRGCHIISIFFDDDAIRVHYVDAGVFKTTNIAYEQLKNGHKLIID